MPILAASVVTLHENVVRGHGVRTEYSVSIALSNSLRIWPIPRSEYASKAACERMIEALRETPEFGDAQYEVKLEGQR